MSAQSSPRVTDSLFCPRRYYARPHSASEGLLALTIVAMVLTLSSNLGEIVVVLAAGPSLLLYLMARLFGGKGDFETSFSGIVLPTVAGLSLVLAILAAGVNPTSTPLLGLSVVLALLVLSLAWLVRLYYVFFTELHALPWWKALLAITFPGLLWVPIALAYITAALCIGLVVTWHSAE